MWGSSKTSRTLRTVERDPQWVKYLNSCGSNQHALLLELMISVKKEVKKELVNIDNMRIA